MLRQWYASRGTAGAVSLSTPVTSSGADPLKRKTLSCITVGVRERGDAKEEQLGYKEKADFITVKVMVRSIPHERPVFYTACPK